MSRSRCQPFGRMVRAKGLLEQAADDWREDLNRLEALQAIADFDSSSEPGVWPQISKSALVADLRSKCEDPYRVYQGMTSLCGPAAIVFEFVERDPASYVTTCQTLYETGELVGATQTVSPSTTLLNSKVHKGISVADWLLMATMRETENAIFRIDADSGDVALGLTTPWEMKGWARELLGFRKLSYTSTAMWGEFDAMRRAETVRGASGLAFLLVTASMIEGTAEPLVAYPNHWVSFLGGLKIDDGVWYRWDSGHVDFSCYSWAASQAVSAGEGEFEDCLWGVVYAEL